MRKHQRCSIKKVFLKIYQNLQENAYAGISFLIKLHAFPFLYPLKMSENLWFPDFFRGCWHGKACNFIKKDTPTQVLFCGFLQIFKNTFFTEHHWDRFCFTEPTIDVLRELFSKIFRVGNFRTCLSGCC